jgi:hypothetical protein
MMSLLTGHRPNDTEERLPFFDSDGFPTMQVRPEVRDRLRKLLCQPELRGVGYSSFIERACEVAETEIAEVRTRRRVYDPTTGEGYSDLERRRHREQPPYDEVHD